MSDYAEKLRKYSGEVTRAAAATDFDCLGMVAEAVLQCHRAGGKVITAGNGGSAATASHMSNDLIKGCRALGRMGIRSVCLCDSVPVLTCLANDFSYEDALAVEFATIADPSDLLVVYSGSGNSENIIRCVNEAKRIGVKTLAFTGRDGGKLKALADLSVIAASDVMEIIEDIHMSWEHGLVTVIRGRLENTWGVETLKQPPSGFSPQAVMFDFDGTVSLIRQGWQDIMGDYFVEQLCETPAYITAQSLGRGGEELTKLRELTKIFINELTGKQTIFQCMRLADEVALRGGEACDPEEYKAEYLRRLTEEVDFRREGLRNGDIKPQRYITPGFIELAAAYRGMGRRLYLASGTDEAEVIKEAKLLGVYELFDGGVFGARDGMDGSSKEYALRKITDEDKISPEAILSYGDGCVETALVAEAGGYAVGVATDEKFLVEKAAGKHTYRDECHIDRLKRDMLKAAGAMAIIPDFTECEAM